MTADDSGTSLARTLVVVPTYNEVDNMPVLLHRLREVADDIHVLIVDDGSPDGTADKADALAAELGNIDVLRRTGPRGLGPAYADGFAWGLAREFDVFVGMDADLSHDPAALPALAELVASGAADMAIGSRYVAGGAIPEWPVHRRVLSRWGNRFATAALALPVRDATSGYRAFSGALLARLDTAAFRAGGYGFLIEMVYRVSRCGGRISETPIVFVDRARGASKMNGRIVIEAFALVTLWGVRDRLASWRRRGGPAGRVP